MKRWRVERTYGLFDLTELFELHAQGRIIGVPSQAAESDVSSLPATARERERLTQ
jgi:hypothetical protein